MDCLLYSSECCNFLINIVTTACTYSKSRNVWRNGTRISELNLANLKNWTLPTLRIEPYELNTVYLHTHSIYILELSLSLREKLFFSSTDSFFFWRARALESCKSNSRRILPIKTLTISTHEGLIKRRNKLGTLATNRLNAVRLKTSWNRLDLIGYLISVRGHAWWFLIAYCLKSINFCGILRGF